MTRTRVWCEAYPRSRSQRRRKRPLALVPCCCGQKPGSHTTKRWGFGFSIQDSGSFAKQACPCAGANQTRHDSDRKTREQYHREMADDPCGHLEPSYLLQTRERLRNPPCRSVGDEAGNLDLVAHQGLHVARARSEFPKKKSSPHHSEQWRVSVVTKHAYTFWNF